MGKRYYIPVKVRSKALWKWSTRFTTREEFIEWFEEYGQKKCSFCNHFMNDRMLINCECPLYDFVDKHDCCIEFLLLAKIYEDYENNGKPFSVKKVNHICDELYDRIDKLQRR